MKLFILLFFSFQLYAISLNIVATGTLKDKKFNNTVVGGLSGLRYFPETNSFFAISDDRSMKSPARIYELKLDFVKSNFEIINVIILKNYDFKNFPRKSVDFEDIEILENGDFLLTSEAQTMGLTIIQSQLFVFSPNGHLKKQVKIDDKFVPLNINGYFIRGQRNNKGFESLCKISKQDIFFVASEEGLVQDSDPSIIRISKYTEFKSGDEYVYQLDPPNNGLNSFLNLGAISGLSAILCLDSKKLLTVERSYHPLLNKFTTSIFETNISPFSTNVFNFESLQNTSYTKLDKKLVLKINDSDNIEGITLGPILENGNKSLILVTDDNFSKFQKSIFYLIEIRP